MNLSKRFADTTAGFSTKGGKNAPYGGEEPALPTLTIISHPNPERIGERVFMEDTGEEKPWPISRGAPDFQIPGKLLGRPLEDPFLSRKPFFLTLKSGGVLTMDVSKTRTEVVVAGRRVEGASRFPLHLLKRGIPLTLADRIVLLLHLSRNTCRPQGGDFGLIGAGDSICHLREEIRRVADLAVPVLLRGPSGTGKELVAQAIHEAGAKGKPFISVNLGAIPPGLAATALFGAKRGSFTGADRDQLGYFLSAAGGTLFLDEVGEAPPEVQAMLLRALETGEIHPVGAPVPRKVKVRLIAATDADLEAMMARDTFKIPLFHRLAGYEIRLAPLCERLDDLGRLLIHFARGELAQTGEVFRLRLRDPYDTPWLPPGLINDFLEFHWPGNIRQLRNTVRQLIIGSRGNHQLVAPPQIREMLAQKPAPAEGAKTRKPSAARPKKRKPSQIPEADVHEALQAHGWDIKASAAALGISRGTLYLLLEKWPGLRKAIDLNEDEIRAGLLQSHGDPAKAAERFRVSPRALKRRMHQLGIKLS